MGPPPSVFFLVFFLARPPLGLNTPVTAVTPLILVEFTRELAAYPLSKRRYVLDGIRLGFRVGWEPDRVSLRSRTSNLRSASDHPDVVEKGSCGFGALWRTQWFCSSWFFPSTRMSIAFLELVPFVVAAHLWGHAWSRLRVQFLCDNMAIVNVLNSGTSKSHDIMHLLRLLTLEACRHNFVFLAAHTPGRDNFAADALSRLRLQEFRRVAPHSDLLPLPIPPSLLSRLVPPA